MTSPTPQTGLLLLDGAHLEDATDTLRMRYPAASPLSLFTGTAYEPISAEGPFLLEAPRGSGAHTAWWEGRDLQHGVWLATAHGARQYLPILQRRLRVFDHRQQELWLRLGDGQALCRAWLAGAQWPTGFWPGVDSLWLRHAGPPVCAWQNPTPDIDTAPANKGLAAQITLPQALVQALSLPATLEKTP